MEKLYDDLQNVGYTDILDMNTFLQAFNDGHPNKTFVDIVAWLSSQLVNLCELENNVSPVDNDFNEKSIGFLVEISSLLKELGCPIKKLITGPVEDRVIQHINKILVITYLCSELQAAKIIAQKKPKKKDTALEIELSESKTAKELREMLISLKFKKPPDTITAMMLFTEVEKKLKTLSNPVSPKDVVGELLFNGCLYEKQWFQLDKLFQEMHKEYKTRKSMLLTRLDVTIRSFLWSDRLKSKSEEVISTYNKRKTGLCEEPLVKISDILAARADMAAIEKTSNATVRQNTKSAVNKVIIGSVPDRGGRPEEQQPPPPEIPSWQKNEPPRGGRNQSSQQSSNYKNPSSYRNENQDPRSYSNQPKGGGYNSNMPNYGGRNESYAGRNENYGGRNEYAYQNTALQYNPQMGNSQCGFGGYMPAGDNFQQYGMNDGYQQRPNSGPRPRGGGGGYRGNRPFRGNRGR